MSGDITQILREIESGDPAAPNRLITMVYDELRRLASSKMARESSDQTLQATALVHDAWIRLGGDHQPNWQNRRHFFGAAAEAMRRILVDRARRRRAIRHGGGLVRADEHEYELAGPVASDELLAVDEALASLARVDPGKAELVKLRYFVGMTLVEAAAALEISEPTAKRWWRFARAWLLENLQTNEPGPNGNSG
ncbi:MAG: sigma-70 family RNA polymerase sigma factor [Opitutaceae bacterium]